VALELHVEAAGEEPGQVVEAAAGPLQAVGDVEIGEAPSLQGPGQGALVAAGEAVEAAGVDGDLVPGGPGAPLRFPGGGPVRRRQRLR
jgi:hypothetical protein